VKSGKVPYIGEAYVLAEQFMTTSAGAKNRKFLEGKIEGIDRIALPMQEILLDPQTSGGLLISTKPDDAKKLVEALAIKGHHVAIVAKVIERTQTNIVIE